MKIQIVCHDNNAGLSRDRQITKEVLEEGGHEVDLTNNKNDEHNGKAYDINIFHEIIDKKYYKQARKNIFFPNPEWYFEYMFKYIIQGIDLICAKTRDCETIFKRQGMHTIYTSFTSQDRRLNTDIKKKRAYLHICGKSEHKGTGHIKMAWLKGGMPSLFLVEAKKNSPKVVKCEGMNHYIGRLSEEDLLKAQNEYWFHLHPSNYEGFGHAIWEAKSCGSIVMTTNGAPMNEFITPDMGILINITKQKKRNLALMKDTHLVYIKKGVEEAEALKDEDLIRMGAAARADWERNDKFFRETLNRTINQLQ